jgi:hypothetical protein
VRTFALSVHAAWRCRSSLRCCTSGWAIPVEPAVRRRIETAAACGRLPLEEAAARARPGGAMGATSWLPRRGGRRWLATTDEGRCMFLEHRGTCGLQRSLGEAAQPVSCRQFPRVAVIEDRGIHVSLTHYCPSAAALLFDSDAPLARVENAFAPERAYEGLDVRGAVAPWLRPGVWLDPEARDAFETAALARLESAPSPEAALAALRAGVERAVRWTPGDGPLARWVARSFGEADERHPGPAAFAAAAAALRSVDACAPPALRASPEGDTAWAPAEAQWVVPAWAGFSRPLRAWLSARLVASWVLWQGDGVRAVVRALELGLLALRALCAREAAREQRPLDRALLAAAIGETDLRLVQRADPRALARLASR